jgi:hypothetical protein
MSRKTKRVNKSKDVKQGARFFQNILEKTKGLLSDDFDDEKDY